MGSIKDQTRVSFLLFSLPHSFPLSHLVSSYLLSFGSFHNYLQQLRLSQAKVRNLEHTDPTVFTWSPPGSTSAAAEIGRGARTWTQVLWYRMQAFEITSYQLRRRPCPYSIVLKCNCARDSNDKRLPHDLLQLIAVKPGSRVSPSISASFSSKYGGC